METCRFTFTQSPWVPLFGYDLEALGGASSRPKRKLDRAAGPLGAGTEMFVTVFIYMYSFWSRFEPAVVFFQNFFTPFGPTRPRPMVVVVVLA